MAAFAFESGVAVAAAAVFAVAFVFVCSSFGKFP